MDSSCSLRPCWTKAKLRVADLGFSTLDLEAPGRPDTSLPRASAALVHSSQSRPPERPRRSRTAHCLVAHWPPPPPWAVRRPGRSGKRRRIHEDLGREDRRNEIRVWEADGREVFIRGCCIHGRTISIERFRFSWALAGWRIHDAYRRCAAQAQVVGSIWAVILVHYCLVFFHWLCTLMK